MSQASQSMKVEDALKVKISKMMRNVLLDALHARNRIVLIVRMDIHYMEMYAAMKTNIRTIKVFVLNVLILSQAVLNALIINNNQLPGVQIVMKE